MQSQINFIEIFATKSYEELDKDYSVPVLRMIAQLLGVNLTQGNKDSLIRQIINYATNIRQVQASAAPGSEAGNSDDADNASNEVEQRPRLLDHEVSYGPQLPNNDNTSSSVSANSEGKSETPWLREADVLAETAMIALVDKKLAMLGFTDKIVDSAKLSPMARNDVLALIKIAKAAAIVELNGAPFKSIYEAVKNRITQHLVGAKTGIYDIGAYMNQEENPILKEVNKAVQAIPKELIKRPREQELERQDTMRQPMGSVYSNYKPVAGRTHSQAFSTARQWQQQPFAQQFNQQYNMATNRHNVTNIECFECHQLGHYKANCPLRRQRLAGQQQSLPSPVQPPQQLQQQTQQQQ